MRDLTQHLTTRADDNRAPPVLTLSEEHPELSFRFVRCQALVRFFALLRIKPHVPPLVRVPVKHLRAYSPGGILIALAAALQGSIPATPSIHRLRPGLLGYLIPFATPAFVPQCQLRPSKALTPPMFLLISTHFTATPGIPFTSTAF